jgi:hypothetical protein
VDLNLFYNGPDLLSIGALGVILFYLWDHYRQNWFNW